jgi:hypothetical protein
MYAFVMPDRVWVRLAELVAAVPQALGKLARLVDDKPALGAIAVLAGLALALLSRLDYAFSVAIAVFVLPYILAVALGRQALLGRIGLALGVAFALFFAVDRSTTVAADYYKFWAGSARRLGDLETAEIAYRGLVRVAPDQASGHYYLGKLLLAHDDELDGMAELHAAEELEPTHARALVEEARYLQLHGRSDAALEVARKGLALEPDNLELKTLIATITGVAAPSGPAAKPAPVPDEDRE